MVIAVAEGIITIGANIMVAYGKVAAAMRTKLYCRTVVMVVAVAEVAVTVGASVVIALGNIVSANGTKLYCGSHFFKAGGKNSDVFGGTA